MERKDNYRVQAQQAKQLFLTYDQEKLIGKLKLKADAQYLYTTFFSKEYRVSRAAGDMERREGNGWVDANSFGEVMTLLDLLCDSREDRFVSGRWKNMRDFGLMFHQNLLEDRKDPWASLFQAYPNQFREACESLGGKAMPNGDIAYRIEVFDGLPIMLQLWLGDEEFPPNLRILWDENALMYLRYETMYFAKGLLFAKLKEKMDCSF